MLVNNNLPYFKLTLTRKETGERHVFYRSVTEYLDYDPNVYDAHLETNKPPARGQGDQMQIL